MATETRSNRTLRTAEGQSPDTGKQAQGKEPMASHTQSKIVSVRRGFLLMDIFFLLLCF